MASFEKRKALVNELRSAHFPFGFQNNGGCQSEYVERYRQYSQDHETHPTTNARANNFTVTNSNGQTNYESEFKGRYPEHEIGNREDPSKLKKIHANKNFVFGYDDGAFETNYKDDFMKKKLEKAQAFNHKQPHINFGGDSLTNFTSTYNDTHNKKQSERTRVKDPPQMRKSNLMFGNDQASYSSQNKDTYQEKALSTEHHGQQSNLSNICLGNDGGSYSSQNKVSFTHKQTSMKPVDKNQVLDFRSAHFQVGFASDPVYQSENKAQYEEKALKVDKAKGNRDSNLNLNMDEKNYFTSTYGRQFEKKNGNKAQPLKNIGQIDSVFIGSDDPAALYTTENQEQYQNRTKDRELQKGKKHESTLELGQTPTEYLTHHQDIYRDNSDKRERNNLSEEQLQMLKGIHFKTGFQDGQYGVTSSNYGKGDGEVNKLTKQSIAAMRNTNIVSGYDNCFKDGTTYKNSFHWKKGEEN